MKDITSIEVINEFTGRILYTDSIVLAFLNIQLPTDVDEISFGWLWRELRKLIKREYL